MDGLAVLRELRSNSIETPVAMLTTSNNERDVAQSLRCGVRGYLLKDMDPDELVRALRDIVAGKTVVAPELAPVLAKVVQGDAPYPADSPFNELTPREGEILALLGPNIPKVLGSWFDAGELATANALCTTTSLTTRSDSGCGST